MDRMEIIEIGEASYHLNYSIEVMFTVTEKYGSVKELFTLLAADDRKGFEAVKDILVLLAEDGELVRRGKGFDHGEFLVLDRFPARPMPYEVINWRESAMRAISKGYNRETKDDAEEVD